MRLKRVTITNLAAFASFAADVPAICLVQGGNGHGKTSFLECIKYAFARRHDSDMIHGDAEVGEVVIEFDNGAAVKARASRKTNETTRGYRGPGSKRFEVSREQIDRMADALSYDPLAFMEFDAKEQVETILRIMPLEASAEEVATAIGDATAEASAAETSGLNVFESIKAVEKAITKARRELNVGADTQEKHAAELDKTLPPVAPGGSDWTAEAARIRAEKESIETAERTGLAGVNAEFRRSKEHAVGERAAAMTAIDTDIDGRIAELERERAERKQTASDTEVGVIEAARQHATSRAEEIRSGNRATLERLAGELATAEERARAQQRAVGTKLAIDAARQEAIQKRERSGVLSAALERLAGLKSTIAARLPIPGVTIEDGRLLNAAGVPFARWNTEAQMVFCLRVGVLAHGDAGFICVDGAERLDSEKRKSLLRAAQKYEQEGLQFLIASVADTPLTIEQAAVANQSEGAR